LKLRQLTASVMMVCMLVMGLPGQGMASVISPEQYLAAGDRSADLARIQSVLDREDVQRQLVSLGVDPDAARERVAALTSVELATLADQLDELPAGGALAVIGVIFVVLIILELVGVIDIFKRG